MQTNSSYIKQAKPAKQQWQTMPETKSKANKPVKHDKRNNWQGV